MVTFSTISQSIIFTYMTIFTHSFVIKRMNTKGYIPVLKSNQCNWVINFKCENPNEIYDKLKSKNITIYRCKGELTNKAIQIAIFNKSYEELEYLIREI